MRNGQIKCFDRSFGSRPMRKSCFDCHGNRQIGIERIYFVWIRMRSAHSRHGMVHVRWALCIFLKYNFWGHLDQQEQNVCLPWASARSMIHSSRWVHSRCWLNCLRAWHSARFISSPKNRRVRIVTPCPQVLLHGDQSLHCVTGHCGSGISMSSTEHSGSMHLFFSTVNQIVNGLIYMTLSVFIRIITDCDVRALLTARVLHKCSGSHWNADATRGWARRPFSPWSRATNADSHASSIHVGWAQSQVLFGIIFSVSSA